MKKNTLMLVSLSAAAIIFLISYSLTILIPTNDNWLMTVRDDWGTHYLGWFFYRNEPWTFPLGNVSRYYFTPGTNVGFTDSIPLMAIFFKIFSPVLPATFQYFGIWLLLCDLLIAYYTIKLLRLFRIRPVYIFLSVLFLITNPVLLYRGMHPALCAHWLLIGSLYYYFLDPKVAGPRKIVYGQLFLLLLSASINPYLCCMVAGVTVALAVKLYWYDKAITAKRFFGFLGVAIAGVLLVWLIIGLINFKKQGWLAVQGAYGLYSLNLNSLYNPVGFSQFLPQQKQVSWHQFESYMYLGLGILLLLLVLVIRGLYGLAKKQIRQPVGQLNQPDEQIAPRGKGPKINGTYVVPLLVLLILYTLFAVTNVISINDRVLFRIPLPKSLTDRGDIFRASARFFWLPYYVILLGILIAVCRIKIRWTLTLSLLVVALALQSYDIKWLLTFRERLPSGDYTPPLDKRWNTLIGQFDNIAFYPPFEAQQLVKMDYQDFCYLAAEAGKPINIGYVARSDGDAVKKYGDSLSANLEGGHISPKTLYITTAPHLRYFAVLLQSDSAQLHTLDGYYYLYATGIKLQRLDTLNARLDAANRGKLDSVLAVTRNKTEFVTTGKISGSDTMSSAATGSGPDKSPILYYIERMNKGLNYIHLSGWGFLDSTQNNKGDSTYFVLRSAGKSYIAPVVIEQRPDLTDAYHRTFLGDAGFALLAFYDSVPAGEYQLGIAIKDQQGRYTYQRDMNKISVREPEK